MKKYLISIFSFVMIVFPLSVFAAIDSLNGLTATIQQLISPGQNATNTMHMNIVQVGTDRHRFRWDGTPWRVDQGGIGLTSIPLLGQLLVGNSSGGYDLVATSSLGITATPMGSNGQIQFNDNGIFGGDDGLVYDKNAHVLTSTSLVRPFSILGNFSENPQGIQIFGGSASPGSNGNGGPLNLSGGVGDGTGSGGGVYLDANPGGQNGDGGNISFVSGSSGSASGNGGIVEIITGSAQSGNGNGGSVVFLLGEGAGAGSDGEVRFGKITSSIFGIFDFSEITTTNKIYTFPDFSGTFGLLDADQVWGGHNTFSQGQSATTTVDFGEIGDTSSRTCFNVKNTDGNDISFYFVGTAMVVENSMCQ